LVLGALLLLSFTSRDFCEIDCHLASSLEEASRAITPRKTLNARDRTLRQTLSVHHPQP
jgi:hypothetical protein